MQPTRSKRSLWIVAGATALSVLVSLSAAGATLEDLPPFAWSHTYFTPSTLGLPVNATAPEWSQRTWCGHRTLLVVSQSRFDQQLLPIFATWAELDGLMVLIAPPPHNSSSIAELRTLAGEQIEILSNNDARAFYDKFRIGELAPDVIFLIDEDACIIYRQTRLSLRSMPDLEPVVLAFAAGDPLPEATITEHLLAQGDQAPWPDFELQSPDGETLSLSAGPIRLLFSGEYVEGQQAALVFHALDELRADYPQVEFVWHLPYVTASGYGAIARMAELADDGTWDASWGKRPVDDYLAESIDLLAAWRRRVAGYAETIAAEWTVALDPGYRLQRWWLIYGAPMVMILDGDGTVLFPCSFFLADHRTGEPVLHSGAIDALREVLDEAVAEGGDDAP
ncbi:hypothetical protein JW848_06745 [Candidatus Bipolaricaulota bacterium]|nr:hypothetical protein [Candidatus Bipolaricaulota bacterium]